MTFDLESKWQRIMAFHMAACLCVSVGFNPFAAFPQRRKQEAV